MNRLSQSLIIEPSTIERIIVPLCGDSSVLLHVNVIRDESFSVDLTETKAALQVKDKEAIGFHCCFDWCCSIDLSLSQQGFVCNRKYGIEFYDSEQVNEIPTIATLTDWIEPLTWWEDDIRESHFRDLQETLSWKFQELSEKDKISIFDKLFPGLEYTVEKPTGTIYLIGSFTGKILKIGYTNHLEQRLRQLQSECGHTLEIIKTKKGTYKTEKEELKKARNFRIQGEWFTWDDSILESFGT